MPHVVPLVLKETVSIVVIGNTGLEPDALRTVLESFNYRVEIHWVGSRAEAIEILKGNLPTFNHLILSCHGEPEDDAILVPDEPPIQSPELSEIVHLPGKLVLNLGCGLGTDKMADAFLKNGAEAYIAATDYVDGNSAIFFAIHLYYFMALPNRKSLAEAVELSRLHDAECGLFKLFLGQ